MKKITNRTKKTVQPDILINTIGCETVNDIYDNYIQAKAEAKKPITPEDLDVVRNNAFMHGSPDVTVFVECNCNKIEKKLPWYKRFWNWLRRK